jgi:CBS domain-containing protein
MSNSATEMLVSACIRFLQAYPPFDRMEAEALRFLAERVRLLHYPKGARILSTEMGVAPPCTSSTAAGTGEVHRRPRQRRTDFVHPRPGSGLRHRRADGAETDVRRLRGRDEVFCYELPADDFFALTQKSSAFNLFCTQHIAGLLKQSQQQLQLQFAQRAAEQKTMNSPLAASGQAEPVSVAATASIREVVELMAARHLGSMVVVDEQESSRSASSPCPTSSSASSSRHVARAADRQRHVAGAGHPAAGSQRARCGAADGHARDPPRARGR